jgi:hypothetical protein
MKCVVWTEKASPQGTIEMGYPCSALPFEWGGLLTNRMDEFSYAAPITGDLSTTMGIRRADS